MNLTGARLLLVALMLSTALAAEPESHQAYSPCDSKLIPSSGDPLAYGRRGERCEGLYVLEVAGSASLSLVAFTELGRAPAMTPEQRPAGGVGGDARQAPGASARHQSRATPRITGWTSYARKAAIASSGRPPTWSPVSTSATLRFGILGWVEQTVGTRPNHVYVPVRFNNALEPAKGLYVARVVPGVELSQLFITLATVGPDGRDDST